MSTITAAGNLARDPELKFTPSGKAVTRMTVMENRRRQVDGEWQDEEPNVFYVEAWGKLAEHAAASLTKGQRVLVVGSVRTSRWADKETKAERTGQTIWADEIGVSLKYVEATALDKPPTES